MSGRVHEFSEVDRSILKRLLELSGRISTRVLAEELGLPRSTVQRRRGFLEKNYLISSYSLNLDNLGFRRVDFFISTHSGSTVEIAKDLLKFPEVTYVGRSVGEHTIDLRVELVIKDNAELLDLLEKVKGMPGISDVVWSEIVEVIGRKRSVPAHVVNRLRTRETMS